MNEVQLFATRDDQYVPLSEDLTDMQIDDLLARLHLTFKHFLDRRPAASFFALSVRAQNVMKRNQVSTVGELAKLLTQARSSTGVWGAGRLVQQEWKNLLQEAYRK